MQTREAGPIENPLFYPEKVLTSAPGQGEVVIPPCHSHQPGTQTLSLCPGAAQGVGTG